MIGTATKMLLHCRIKLYKLTACNDPQMIKSSIEPENNLNAPSHLSNLSCVVIMTTIKPFTKSPQKSENGEYFSVMFRLLRYIIEIRLFR